MGAGKTTIGKILAERLHWSFVDLDNEIERRTAMSVAEIFSKRGEAGFRAEEAASLRDLMARVNSQAVIALGGGAFEQPEIRALVQQSGGKSFWLDAAPQELWRRCAAQPGSIRPLQQHRKDFFQLFEKRRAAYSEAHQRVATAGAPEEIAQIVLDVIQNEVRD